MSSNPKMSANPDLTALALSVGKVHGAIVEAAVRGSAIKAAPSLPPTTRALARLRDLTKLPQKDYDQLSRIVGLAANENKSPDATASLKQIRQIDEEFQRAPDRVHPLILAISSIASDSAQTALAALTPAATEGRTTRRKEEKVNVVLADVLGAVLGGIAGAKAGKSMEAIIVGAAGGAILASSTVGAGNPFPRIAVLVE